MGYDHHFMTFFCDGPNEGAALTILGSLRSLQQQQQQHPRTPAPMQVNTNQQNSQQTKGDNTMVDRAAATRDKDKERVRRKYSKNVDVRYMKSLRCLRNRLLRSSYSCSVDHCPAIKQRFEQHQLKLHSSTACSSTPKQKEDVKNVDKLQSCILLQSLFKGSDDDKPKFDSSTNLTSQGRSKEIRTGKCAMPHTQNHSTVSFSMRKEHHRKPPSSPNISLAGKSVETNQNQSLMTILPSKEKNVTSAPKSALEEHGDQKAHMSNYMNASNSVTNGKTIRMDKFSNTNIMKSKSTSTFTIFDGSGSYDSGITGTSTADDTLKFDDNNCSFAVLNRHKVCECRNSQSRNYIRNDSTLRQNDNTHKVMINNEIGINSIPTIPYQMRFLDKSSNTKLESSNSLNKRKKCNENMIYKEVGEWIREIPLYPGLSREEKESKDNAVSNLIGNVIKHLIDASNTEFDQKVRNEIDACLNKIPIWYPGTCTALNTFKNNLSDHLLQRIKSLNKIRVKKTCAHSYSPNTKIAKNIVSEKKYDGLLLNQFKNDIVLDVEEIKVLIKEWLWSIYPSLAHSNGKGAVKISDLADSIVVRVISFINKSTDTINIHNYKLVLEKAIIDIINDLPINRECLENLKSHIQKLGKDLADKLLSNQVEFVSLNRETNNSTCCYEDTLKTSMEYHRKSIISNELRKCFKDAKIDLSSMVLIEACVILLDYFKKPALKKEESIRNELFNLFVTSTNLSETQANKIAEKVIKKLKFAISKDKLIVDRSKSFIESRKPITVSTYTSMGDLNSPLLYLVTSTPKKKSMKKKKPKLNPQEIQYMEKVANLVRAWMTTLPVKFDGPEEKKFKETAINDLTGDIMDEIKLDQLVPGIRDDRRKYLKYISSRWIFRLGSFEVTEVDHQIENLLDKLKEIPVPVLTQPQHGNRQAMENLKFNAKAKRNDNFLPKGTDILEDEISIWMNEQPSNIFINNDPGFRQDKIRELAQVLENKLKNKRLPIEISTNVAQWLNDIIKSEEKHEIKELTENLKDRVIFLPQDATLAAKLNRELNESLEHKNVIAERITAKRNSLTNSINMSNNYDNSNNDNTIKMLISKFIEHNYDVDDPLARSAYNRLLITNIQKLTPTATKEVCSNIEKNLYDSRFPAPKLIRELEYIKDISDWLKNIPIDASYNSVGNKDRIDFVNNLAISIREVEEEREKDPNAMDYNLYLAVIIHEFLQLLPLPKEYYKNVSFIIEQLLNKIYTHRQYVTDKLNRSANTTGVNIDNIGDFIEEFLRINGDEIADDEVKLEAWSIRLIREIKNIVRDTSRNSVLSKSYIYNKLTDVPIPGEETIKMFNLELDYVNEVSSWLKNLPLLRVNESKEDNQTIKVCELVEKITEMVRNKTISPHDTVINPDLKEYIIKWIADFPLDSRHEIVIPIVIQQLLNRIQKVNKKHDPSEVNMSQYNKNSPYKDDKNMQSSSNAREFNKDLTVSSSNEMIDVIEKWVKELPLQESVNGRINVKENICRQLFKKVSQLNIDPRAYNDDFLYQTLLSDEIDSVFDNLPQLNALENKKETLKNDIVFAINEAKNNHKEKMAGDTYKHKLENTIEASIPDPISITNVFDPGFEIYKDRLVKIFILENFDHGNDVVKMKYERLLKKEVDKYFDHAKSKNAAPISKDRLNLELYRTLFKVPIPNETSVIAEVEEIKTRCEIDAWFEELPIREAYGLNEQLEWEKILSTLAKRIHEIETKHSQPDQEILKEVFKWVVKFPLLPRTKLNFEALALNLLERLRSTAAQRKCTLENPKHWKGKERAKINLLEKPKENSQIAGPSSSSNIWTSLSRDQQNMSECRRPKKKAADEIFEIVHSWCSLIIPTNAKTQDDEILKDKLTTKIIIKISELNTDPNIFNNNNLYEDMLDEELEKLLSTIPATSDFQNSKEARKYQLIEAIKATKPILMEERAKHSYMRELNKTVDKVLGKPTNMPSDDEVIFNEVKDSIIDDFIQYKYENDSDNDKQSLKKKVNDNISKLVNNTANNKNEQKENLLMKTNQLLCELTMVSEKFKINLRDEIDEIRMKRDIADFFHDLMLHNKGVDKSKLNYCKASLARKLNELEINGYNLENENKMKKEITRCLNKLHVAFDFADIDDFVSKLKKNELRRKLQLANKQAGNDAVICQENCWQRGRQGLQKSSSYLIIDEGSNYSKTPVISFNEPIHDLEKRSNHKRIALKPYQQENYGNMEVVPLRDQNSSSDSELYEEKPHIKRKTCYFHRKLKGYRRPCYMFPRYIYYCCESNKPYWCSLASFV